MKQNSFSTNFLDRASLKRSNEMWINDQFNNESARIIPVSHSKILCTSIQNPRTIFLTKNDLNDFSNARELSIFLGINEKMTYFAIGIESMKSASILSAKNSGEFYDFKQVMPLLNFRDSALLAIARFMINWQSRNRYCGKCGTPTKSAEAGNLRICENANCGQNHFPSMDPAIIVLVSFGEYCLLGRQKIWPKGMYSTIAGFVEPGESVEDAVIREVNEETGIIVEKLEYQHSQPWLFPSSLMLGFTAAAKGNEIKIDKNELEDARWFSRKEIKDNLKKGLLRMPSKVAIAYHLIEEWFNKGDVGKLDAI
jgi:NAD+ diphosphatase